MKTNDVMLDLRRNKNIEEESRNASPYPNYHPDANPKANAKADAETYTEADAKACP